MDSYIFHFFYFGKYLQGRFRVASAGGHICRSKVFLGLRILCRYRSEMILADTDAKSYPSLLHLFKLIRKGQSLSHEQLKSSKVYFPLLNLPTIARNSQADIVPCHFDLELAVLPKRRLDLYIN